MTLQRTQIDVLLEDLEATAWRRHRADPADPTLSRDIAEQARALLRVATIDLHLHICDSAQHLLLRLGGDDADGSGVARNDARSDAHRAADDGILRAVQPTREHVPDLGIALGIAPVADPFDLDAYVPRDGAAASAAVLVRHAAATPPPAAIVPSPAPASTVAPAPTADRRAGDPGPLDERELRRGLTAQQLLTLDTMAHFGWTLRFVRRPLFHPPVPVAFDRGCERFVVIAPDGTIEDSPGLRIRD